MRTVVTLTMLTVLLIDLFERQGWHAAILIGLAPIVAFLTNGVRVVTLVLNPYSDVASIHNLQGIAMLLVGLTVIYLIDEAIERLRGGDQATAHEERLPLVPRGSVSNRVETIRLAILCGVLLVMHASAGFVPAWSVTRYVEESSEELLDRVLGDWPSEKIEPDYNFLGSVRFLTWDHRRVRVNGGWVDVFVAAADEQRREQTILTPRLAWPASGYVVTDTDRRPLRSLGTVDRLDASVDARRFVLRRGPKSVLSYSWYERSGGLAVEWFRQAVALDRSPFVRPRHMLAIRLSTTLGEGRNGLEDAEARVRRVYERLAPELDAFAPMSPP
jgi:exosortase/archaeosortase family protein